MTVKEYNQNYYPLLQHAKYAVLGIDNAIDHMNVDQLEVKKQLNLRGWDTETKLFIIEALEFYNEWVKSNLEK